MFGSCRFSITVSRLVYYSLHHKPFDGLQLLLRSATIMMLVIVVVSLNISTIRMIPYKNPMSGLFSDFCLEVVTLLNFPHASSCLFIRKLCVPASRVARSLVLRVQGLGLRV